MLRGEFVEFLHETDDAVILHTETAQAGKGGLILEGLPGWGFHRPAAIVGVFPRFELVAIDAHGAEGRG